MLRFHYPALSPFAITLVLAVFLSCSSGDGDPGISEEDGWPFDSSGEELEPSSGLESLNLEDVIEIKYNNGSAPEINNTFSEVSINPVGEDVVVMIPNTSTKEYNFVLSGTASNGSLKFYGNVRKGLYLNGLSITNSKGPAINIQGNKRVLVHLLNGTQNFLTDAPSYSNIPNGEDAKGTFFSEGKLEFEGSGSLEVKGKYNHAIVVDNDFEINNGKIIVSESVNDGIHANDKIKIKGGVLDIASRGDAIQNESDSIKITGGKIKAKTANPKSHGIASEGPTSIGINNGNPIIQISVSGNGSKGIRSRMWVEFLSGKTFIKASGTKHIDSDDESTPAGIKLATDLFIEGGELIVKSLGSEAKGISTDRDATISAGNVNVDADDDGIKVKGKLKIEGGTVYVKSRKTTAIDAESPEITVDVTTVNGKF